MSFNRKMILKHWRISISWISKTERGIVSKGGVKYFTNLSSSTMARQGTGQPLCDPPAVNSFLILACLVYNFVSLPLTFPLLFPPPPPVSISSRAMLILAETIQYWQWCIPRKVTCLLFLIIRTFFRGPNSWHVLVVVEKKETFSWASTLEKFISMTDEVLNSSTSITSIWSMIKLVYVIGRNRQDQVRAGRLSCQILQEDLSSLLG